MLSVDSKYHAYAMNAIGVVSMVTFPFTLFYINDWFYILSAIVGIIFITKFGQAIGQHRYFSHKSFQCGPYWHKTLAIFATLSCTGTIIHYSAIHRAHHRFSDTEMDPHSPKHNGYVKIWFADLDDNISQKIPKKIVVDLMRDDFVRMLHTHYWYVILAYVAILLIINPMLFVTMFIIPVGYSRICTGMQATISHKYGYKNFATKDASTNNLLVNILSLGEGSHNNHHYNQTNFDFGFTGYIIEFDFSAWLIRKFILGTHNETQA